jgi:hypothetical protein
MTQYVFHNGTNAHQTERANESRAREPGAKACAPATFGRIRPLELADFQKALSIGVPKARNLNGDTTQMKRRYVRPSTA